MTEQPDIEIYVKRAELAQIQDWLKQFFTIHESHPAGETQKLTLQYEQKSLCCTVFEKAAKGGYTSICFEPNHTPWETDEDCARQAFEFFDLETRCITGGWSNGEADQGGWYRFTENGRSVVNWLT